MPAPKLSPTSPRITTLPPVIYSHAFDPLPSTTAEAIDQWVMAAADAPQAAVAGR
ncbi:hypothetical protein N9S15_01500 [bacterium]|nr:hypothetical protein [bacterium]